MPEARITWGGMPDAHFGLDVAVEDAIIGKPDDAKADPNEPLGTTAAAKKYFNSVDETEAMNYILYLHDTHLISFDRLEQLKKILTKTPKTLPKTKKKKKKKPNANLNLGA